MSSKNVLVYQAYHWGEKGWIRHHGVSRTQVENEAKLRAQEIGGTVHVDEVGIDNFSADWLIHLLNGTASVERKRIKSFLPTGKKKGKKWEIRAVKNGPSRPRESSVSVDNSQAKEFVFGVKYKKDNPNFSNKKVTLSAAAKKRLKKLRTKK
tara:strand:- start:246 stop:701 length:456 start_codon:yes stop_codon:yes gene_type:complete